MVKVFSISLSDFVYNTYLGKLKKMVNRSRYIEKLIILGSESQLNIDETIKIRLMEAHQEIANKKIEIDTLKLENGRLRHQLDKKKKKKEKETITVEI